MACGRTDSDTKLLAIEDYNDIMIMIMNYKMIDQCEKNDPPPEKNL